VGEPILETRGLVKRFGGVLATDDLSVTLEEGEFRAVIGPNGAGKTTLIAQLMGELAPSAGIIRFAGENVTRLGPPGRARRGMARSFQITSLCPSFTALDNVALAVQARDGHSFRFWRDVRSDGRLQARASEVLAQAGLARRAHDTAASLAHGEQRQLEIAVALAGRPRLLLLDEPMAGMGREDGRQMVELLRALKGRSTILLVEHDMDVVFGLADRISVLVYGRCIATGTPAEIRASEEVRKAYLGEGDA